MRAFPSCYGRPNRAKAGAYSEEEGFDNEEGMDANQKEVERHRREAKKFKDAVETLVQRDFDPFDEREGGGKVWPAMRFAETLTGKNNKSVDRMSRRNAVLKGVKVPKHAPHYHGEHGGGVHHGNTMGDLKSMTKLLTQQSTVGGGGADEVPATAGSGNGASGNGTLPAHAQTAAF